MFVFGLVIGVVAGIGSTLLFQKYVLGTFKKVSKAVSDIKTDLK